MFSEQAPSNSMFGNQTMFYGVNLVAKISRLHRTLKLCPNVKCLANEHHQTLFDDPLYNILLVCIVVQHQNAWSPTVQPKNNARARSGARCKKTQDAARSKNVSS